MHDRSKVPAPGVITGRYGTIGAVYFQEIDFWPLNTTLWVSDFHGNYERFIYYLLQRVNFATHSGKSGVPGVNRNDLHTEIISLPKSTDEQREIAKALTDCDDLITALERLISKKRAIKQGMMQQLLTGKIRLPGFVGAWKRSRLGDVLAIRHGKSQKAIESPSGQYPILATGGQIGWTNTPLYRKPSVLIGRKGTIDRPQFQAEPFWTVDTLFYTEISPAADPRFLYYVFLTVDWRSMNEASGVPSLSSTRVEGVEVSIPPFEEQIKIRTVLDDVDSEIGVLRTRLEKARSIKQGMMQELLTGRTRLPIAEAAS